MMERRGGEPRSGAVSTSGAAEAPIDGLGHGRDGERIAGERKRRWRRERRRRDGGGGGGHDRDGDGSRENEANDIWHFFSKEAPSLVSQPLLGD